MKYEVHKSVLEPPTVSIDGAVYLNHFAITMLQKYR